MIARSDALQALAAEEFDVVVIGGGITGAGVALDAATRGYSVALVEKADYASGTSSRSSKLVHGGLRYLQNFDLGLVREALLERQLMVAARAAPRAPAAARRRRRSTTSARTARVGAGLHLYDVMSVERLRGRRPRRFRKPEAEPAEWSPDRHRTIDGDEVVRLIPALAARASPPRATSSTTARPTTAASSSPSSARPSASARSWPTAVEVHRARARRAGARRACACATVAQRRGVHDPRRQRRQRDRRVGRPASAPRSCTTRPRCRASARRAAPTSRCAPRTSRSSPARSSPPAAAARSSRCRGSAARSIGTTDNDYDGRRPRQRARRRDDIEYLLDATNAFFGTDLGPGDITGAYAGVRPLISTGDPKKSVDISRKAELYETELGMITITGGKLTTWRRMAKMAVDRMVERDNRDAPCRTHEIPLGYAVVARRPAARRGRARGRLRRAGRPLRPRRPRRAAGGRRARRAGPADRPRPARPAGRGGLSDPPRAGRAWPTSCSAAPGSACWPRASCSSDDPAPVRRVAEALGREAGWDEGRIDAEVDRVRRRGRGRGHRRGPGRLSDP